MEKTKLNELFDAVDETQFVDNSWDDAQREKQELKARLTEIFKSIQLDAQHQNEDSRR